MSTFAARKVKKKQTKYVNILKRDFATIDATEEVTRHLMVCNVGLLTNNSESDLVEYFSQFGRVDNVCMIPGKSYSFLSFADLDSSLTCYSSNHEDARSVLNISSSLHLLYVNRLPDKRNISAKFLTTPPGLIILDDFINESEEELLVNIVEFLKSDKVLKHRSVKHYGYEFNYDTNDVDGSKPLLEGIPDEVGFLFERLIERSSVPWRYPDQLTVNCYQAGQGIPPHVDTHSPFMEPIISLSLLSDVVMDFCKCDGSGLKSSVLLPRRSLTLMTGESRYFWTHGITPRKSDVISSPDGSLSLLPRAPRISFTFRKLRSDECNCPYPSVCDSFLKRNIKSPSSESAKRIEKLYVHQVYEEISDHFSLTRHSPWPKVKHFIQSFETGSILLDIGSGNGKYFNLNSNIYHFGGDTCLKLNLICKSKGEVLTFNCLSLPFRDSSVDGIICIAVLHHLSNEDRRYQALKEILRVLRTAHGRALIYVWAKDQKTSNYLSKTNEESNGNKNSKDELPPSVAFIETDQILPVHSNRTNFKYDDLLVPWNVRLKDKEESCYLRFYHVFKEGELDEMCLSLGAQILDSYFDEGNWCLEIMKS